MVAFALQDQQSEVDSHLAEVQWSLLQFHDGKRDASIPQFGTFLKCVFRDKITSTCVDKIKLEFN